MEQKIAQGRKKHGGFRNWMKLPDASYAAMHRFTEESARRGFVTACPFFVFAWLLQSEKRYTAKNRWPEGQKWTYHRIGV